MHKLAQITFGLTLATSPLAAQTAMNTAPIPGPYQVIIQPQFPAPVFGQQRYAPPLPYWMQVQPRPIMQQQATEATAPQHQATAVGRAASQPFMSGWNWSQAPQTGNANTQGYGSGTPTPGYFPGYSANQQPRQPRPAPNYNPTNPAAQNYQNYQYYAGQPWGQPWGPQGFMPMGTPWGNGWNSNGYGYRPGYAPQPQQQR